MERKQVLFLKLAKISYINIPFFPVLLFDGEERPEVCCRGYQRSCSVIAVLSRATDMKA